MAKRNVDYTPVPRFLSPGLAFCMQLLFLIPLCYQRFCSAGVGVAGENIRSKRSPLFRSQVSAVVNAPTTESLEQWSNTLRSCITFSMLKLFHTPLCYLCYQRLYSHSWGGGGGCRFETAPLFFDPIVRALNNRIRKNDHQTFITLPIPS